MIEQYAADYSAAEQRLKGTEDDQSSIHYPTVFLFIGDESEQAIEPMMKSNELRWANNAGVVYCHVSSTSGANAGKGSGNNFFNIPLTGLPTILDDKRTIREQIGKSFHSTGEHLIVLNRTLRRINDSIGDYGRMYASFDRLHLAVITRADDPMNILLPDVVLLAQSIFGSLFKSVQMDLFVLIQEREQAETFGYAAASGISFLRELERFQQPDFHYNAPLQMTGDGLTIPVDHGPASLFDLVYMLSDRNERGMTAHNGMEHNYEIICRIMLLKNKSRKDSSVHYSGESYNNTSFKHSLRAESGRIGFVSAGLAKVQRPAYAIALTVLYHLFDQIIVRLQATTELGSKEKLRFFGLDAVTLTGRSNEMISDGDKLDDMKGLITSGIKYEQLRGMTLREAEAALYGNGCEAFFNKHFVEAAERRLQNINISKEIQYSLSRSMKEHTEITFYHLFKWTDENNATGEVTLSVRDKIRELTRAIEDVQQELEATLSMRVEDLKFQRVPFMDKRNVRTFIHTFLDVVYGLRLAVLKLETELSIYRRFAIELEVLNQWYRVRIERMNDLRAQLKMAAKQSISLSDDYIGQNVFEYYERVTTDVIQELEEKRGASMLFEERYIGNVLERIEQGESSFIERLIIVCRRDILTTERFNQSFEEELLQRANVSVSYSNRKVLPKDELFQQLYRMLEENATINIRLFDYTHKLRYEEQYFFGDRNSEFIRYAFGMDEASRIHKLGSLHENRSSGVEKLHLMGGFHLEDLIYYRNAKVFYEAYLKDGYKFHSIDQNELPVLR
ncbi:transcription initiation factor TFIID [Paenibacillus sp. GSMTC-2017]|uniref:transcription initiation factor TFIID n=1 Tax=Paenibacillus sp. GSMTC-2017 TaxID=2794350 RepID=UPI001E39C7F5|nr:transcription initiation factor TFIID [Paenibacillus sp. GSMTC-2017]